MWFLFNFEFMGEGKKGQVANDFFLANPQLCMLLHYFSHFVFINSQKCSSISVL